MMFTLPDPEIVTAPVQSFVGLSERFTMDTRHTIPALYERFFQAQFCPEHGLCGALYGLSYNASAEGFDYAVAVRVSDKGALPEGACRLSAPAGPYAVFRHRGPVTEIPAMFDAIFSQWLPASGRSPAPGPVFERYPDDPDCEDGVMKYEIWVPLAG